MERQQVQKLRDALERAKVRLQEQQEMLEELTSPPVAYATVVAVSDWTSAPLARTYVGVGGDEVILDPQITSLAGYSRGDRLQLVRNVSNQHVRSAQKFIVVGFVDDRVVTQIDDGLVVIDSPSVVSEYYEVLESSARLSTATAVIVVKGDLHEVRVPKHCVVSPGDTVTVVMESLQIIDVASVQVGGNVCYLRRVIDETFSEVDFESAVRVVFNGRFVNSLDKGDRVVLDGSDTVIVRNLGKDESPYRFTSRTDVAWDDIGGLHEAKQHMREAVELPYTHADIFGFYGKKPIKGILLYGPPGCGKTMLGKATATALAELHTGNGSSSGFMYIKGPEILDRYVGVAEATIRQIFQAARRHKNAHGFPAVVFIDEADAILGKRGSGISSDIERTIVPMFLTEMDGLEDSGALIILATNRSDTLDPAVVRDRRIDRKIKIGRPMPDSASEIFLLNLRDVPLNNGYAREELARYATSELFSPRRVLYRVQRHSGDVADFVLCDIVNGGMIAGIVDQATSIALHRDLAQGVRLGVCKEDLRAAVDAVESQNRDLNHKEELAEFVHDFRDDVANIQRLRQSTV